MNRGATPAWLDTAAALSWRVVALAAAVYVAGVAFTQLHLVIIPVVGALFLATVLVPPARYLRAHGWPPLLATWAVFLSAIALGAGIVIALIPTVSSEASTLSRDLSSAATRTENWLTGSPLHISRTQIDSTVSGFRSTFDRNRATVVQGALTGATVAAQVVGGLLLTLVLTFFFVKDGAIIGDWIAGLGDDRRAEDLREVGSRAWSVLGGYVRGTAVNGLVNAVVLCVGLAVIGVPLVVPIGLLTFVGAFVPLVGGIVTGGVAALVALAAKGPVAALVMVGLTVLIHNLEGYLVGPLVLGRAVRLHPVAILLALSIGTLLGGVLGAFLAVPLLAVALSVNEYYRIRRRERMIAGHPAA